MTLFEIVIKGTGSLERDVIKVAFQIVEMLLYVAALCYLWRIAYGVGLY